MSDYQAIGIMFVILGIVVTGVLFWVNWSCQEYGKRNKEFLEYARMEYEKDEGKDK